MQAIDETNGSSDLGRFLWRRAGVLLAFALILFFGFKLGDRALWSPVEGHYAEIAREMVVSHDYLTPWLAGIKYLEKPPLFAWLLSANIQLFGLSEWSLRFWPAFFAVFSCMTVYFAATTLFDRAVGALAALVLATSTLWYIMAHVIDLDMTVSALISCALLCFLVANRTRDRERAFGVTAFYICSALATLTKGLIGIVIPAMVVGAWICVLGEWKILKRIYLLSGALLFLTIAAPWFLLVERANPGFLRSYLIDEHFRRYLTKPDGPFEQPWAYIPVLLLGLMPWIAFLLQSLRSNFSFRWRDRRQHKEVLFLALWAGLVFLFYSASSYKGVPYILPVFPPLAILMARYLAAAWRNPSRAGLRSGALALVPIFVALAAAGLSGPQHFLERYANWPAVEAVAEGTVASVQTEQFADLSGLRPYVFAQSAILIAAALCVSLMAFGNRWKARTGFVGVIVAWALFLVVLNSSLPILDQRRSVKSLAQLLRSQAKRSDFIASYHAYYQDLPVYLDRPIAVVGWHGNLQFGLEVNERSGGWMMDDASFWQEWNSSRTVFMLTEETTLNALRAHNQEKFHIIARGLYDVVVTNRSA